MRQPTSDELKAEFARLGYKWLPFQGIAIRSRSTVTNTFDDLIGFIDRDKVWFASGTTEPGKWHLNNPGPKLGTGMVVPGQYIDCWEPGLHHGKYDAWRQCAPIKCYRDNDRDDIPEETKVIEEGMFHHNWHCANQKAVSQVNDKWSAMCFVQNDPVQYFDVFIRASHETGLTKYSATLLKEWL